MNSRIALIAALTAAALPAMAATCATPKPGEPAFTLQATPAGKTREQVLNELAAWWRNPVTADGWKEVGAEGRWVYVARPHVESSPAVVKKVDAPCHGHAGAGADALSLQ